MIVGYFDRDFFYRLGNKHPVVRLKAFELKDRIPFMVAEGRFYRFRTKDELMETAVGLKANVIASGAGGDVGSYFYFFKKEGIIGAEDDEGSLDALLDVAGRPGLKKVVAGNVVLI